MGCNCNDRTYSISMGCCEPVLAPIENYYTKYQVDKMIEGASGCCITPEEVESAITSAITYVEGEIPSLSGYATEQWVLDKHYITGVNLSDYVTFEDMAEYVGDVYTKQEVNNLFVTKATFNTYITNLQQQIDSLKETISACCSSTGETEYRWIVKPNDYTCSGTTKMTKEIQQSSTDGINWTDTGEYRTGSTVLEYDSTDCGYVPSSNFKVRANYTVGSGQVECNSSTTLSQEEVKSITFATYFTSIEFGDCIDTIGEDAFVNVRTISSVTIPSNITTLKSCAFNNCGIQNYVLNNGLTTIEHTAFINNYNLSAITIPSTVTSIGSQAFFNCTALTTVTINATTPPTVSSSSIDAIFNNCSSLTTIYVPASSVDTYKAADGWSLYADLIRAIQ